MVSPTFTAGTATAADQICVLRCELMPTLAVSLASVLGSYTITAQNVLRDGNWFQMIWIDTVSDPTEMIQRHPFGDLADENFVDDSVNIVLAFNNQSAVAPTGTARPQPASIRT